MLSLSQKLSVIILAISLCFGAYSFGEPNDLTTLRKIAEQGNKDAQYKLGQVYVQKKNDQQAVRWWRRAAEQGHPTAQAALGASYLRGEGTIKDPVQAHMWLNLASVQEPAWAVLRDLVADDLTPAQIQEAQRLAREWKPKPE